MCVCVTVYDAAQVTFFQFLNCCVCNVAPPAHNNDVIIFMMLHLLKHDVDDV